MASLQDLCDPPFLQQYSYLFSPVIEAQHGLRGHENKVIDENELPLIDLHCLQLEQERMACVAEIGNAASEWGFFQVVNHGINTELLQAIRNKQMMLFHAPFEQKAESKALNESYRWGNPAATSLDQVSWSEAFHVPLSKLAEGDSCWEEELRSLRLINLSPFAFFSRNVLPILTQVWCALQ